MIDHKLEGLVVEAMELVVMVVSVLVIMEGVDTVVVTVELKAMEVVMGEATFLRVAIMEVDMVVVSVWVAETMITMLVLVLLEMVIKVMLRVLVLLATLVVVITLLVIVGQMVALRVVDLEEVPQITAQVALDVEWTYMDDEDGGFGYQEEPMEGNYRDDDDELDDYASKRT
ncbi:hypothetical protein NMG60_11023900 [Bertholletia excelsa]